MAEDLTTTIDNAAAGPQSAASDGQSMQARPLGELIALDRYRRSEAAQAKNHMGIRFQKLQPPGAD